MAVYKKTVMPPNTPKPPSSSKPPTYTTMTAQKPVAKPAVQPVTKSPIGTTSIHGNVSRDITKFDDKTKAWEMQYLDNFKKGLSSSNEATANIIRGKYGIKDEPKFEFNYNALDYNTAASQAQNQVDPMYKRAIENINAQKYQNELNSGEIASKRGLSHSGLAADQLNKIAIASQGQISDVEAQRAQQIAELAQRAVSEDKAREMQMRQQAYQEYMGAQDLSYRDKQFNYQSGRDALGDQRYNQEWLSQEQQRALDNYRQKQQWNYNVNRDKVEDRWRQGQFDYQKDRDKVADQQWRSSFDQQVKQQAADNAWREKTFNNMSASEKAQLAWNKQQFGENMAWEIEANNRSNQLERDSWEFQAGLSGFPLP